MLSDFTGADKVYIACGYTDLRKGIDGLASMVQQQFQLDPFTNTLFLFCGRRRDRIKGLYWEKDGFILLYKRLERGAYQWPRSENEVRSLKAGVAQYQIAEDLSCDIRTIQRYEAGEQFPDWNELLKMKVRYSCEFADLFPEEFR